MSALRLALRTADEDEREQKYQALLAAASQDLDGIPGEN